MEDRTVTVTCVMSGILWVAAFSLVGLAIGTNYAPIGQVGILCAGVGVVLNTRSIAARMERRQSNAFDLGRDVGRDNEVRSIH